MPDTLKLKRGTKSVAETSTKVLEKDEILAITPDLGSGKGKYQFKFGDGVTPVKDLPIAMDGENAHDMKVSTIATISDENPVLTEGDTISEVAGKINKQQDFLKTKLGYERLGVLIETLGALDNNDFVGVLEKLNSIKFDKNNVYDGTDSTSTELASSANSVRQVKELTDNNTSAISTLNSNFEKNVTGQNADDLMNGLSIGSSIINAPDNDYWAIITNRQGPVGSQQAIRISGGTQKIRTLASGTWRKWVANVSTDDFLSGKCVLSKSAQNEYYLYGNVTFPAQLETNNYIVIMQNQSNMNTFFGAITFAQNKTTTGFQAALRSNNTIPDGTTANIDWLVVVSK